MKAQLVARKRILDPKTNELLDDEKLVALDGIYASMYNRIDFLSANTHQTFGNMAIFLAADLMGEDMVQTAKGPGWFWNDYTYGVRERYASKIQRCYFVWAYFYELINNANAIITAGETATGDTAARDCILGQAYAIRAFCYFMLIQSYQQTSIGHHVDIKHLVADETEVFLLVFLDTRHRFKDHLEACSKFVARSVEGITRLMQQVDIGTRDIVDEMQVFEVHAVAFDS